MSTTSLGFRAAALTGPAGTMNLAVAQAGRRSVPARTEFNGVLRLMQPLYLDGSGQVTYVVVNPGGAYFGEEYAFDVETRPGASLLLTTQSATRIHRTPVNPAVQTMRLRLGEGSRLEYLPEQLIAYRDAVYEQWTTMTVHPTAQAFLAEVITPGWDPDGLPLTYTDLRLRTEIRESTADPDSAEGRLVAVDSVRLRPEEFGRSRDGLGTLEGFSHVGSVVVVGPQTTEEYADSVRAEIESLTADGSRPIRAGVTRGERNGVSWMSVRALAHSTGDLNTLIVRLNGLDRTATTGQEPFDLRRY